MKKVGLVVVVLVVSLVLGTVLVLKSANGTEDGRRVSFEVQPIGVKGFEGELSYNLREAVKTELAKHGITAGHPAYEALFSPHTAELTAVLKEHNSKYDKIIRITNVSHEILIPFHSPDGFGVQWIVGSERYERIKTKSYNKLSHASKLRFSGWQLVVVDSIVSENPYWEVRAYQAERAQQ